MFKKQHLALAIAATLAAGAAQAALETSVTLKNETARFLKDGIRTGEATTSLDNTGEGKTTYKFENTAKIYLNDKMDNGMSWHGELNIVRDTKAINDYKGHENYTQRDWLRELYVDTTIGDWDARIGKQQVVWGTADGIKLLDMINPTDWSEFNQNAPADARIPVWMVNAERYLDNGANIQAVFSQAKENKIAGFNANGDAGHPFIMKGVDSISGNVNGFYNIAPALASVAYNFSEVARTAPGGGMGFDVTGDGTPDALASALTGFAGLTVDGFAGRNQFTNAATSIICSNPAGCGAGVATATDGNTLLENFTENGATFGLPYSNSNITNLSDSDDYIASNPTSTFEYMSMASFATFNTFAGNSATSTPAAVTTWKRDLPKDLDGNLAFRFRNSTPTGMNYSFNYAYRYDSNPTLSTSWHDAVTGERLTTVLAKTGGYGLAGYHADPENASGTGGTFTPETLPTSFTADVNGNATDGATVLLRGSTGYYGAVDPNSNAADGGVDLSANSTNGTELRFNESLNRIHSIGTSFDYAMDMAETPVVIRGEFLYDKDVATPVVNKLALAYGDLEHGLTSQKADFFKYVIGADVTVLTDMMLSGQFIQFRNLDFKETSRTCTSQMGTSLDCSTYTADQATMHLSNGLQKAEKNKEFYSLFLSKPFGESGEGRWNNIFIYEEGGGKWNRFDVEYGFDDQLIGTFEVNKYFGDENTMFGQFENASNVQIGVKYLLQ